MWTIILVTSVIAVIVSVVTSSITGNVVRVPSSTATTQVEVYTKAEIDGKLNATNQGVLNMFRDKCLLTNPNLYFQDLQYKVYWVCEKYNAQYNKSTTCALADQFNNGRTQVLNCNSVLTAGTNSSSGIVHVMCCSP